MELMNLKKLSTYNDQINASKDSLLGMIQIDETTTRDYSFEKVNDPKDFYHALKLVKDVYVAQGYIDPEVEKNPIRMLKHHLNSGSAVFIGKTKSQIAFTVSLFPDSSIGIPMDELFKKDLDVLRNKGRRIAEVGCLATHPDHRSGNQNILIHGNKIMLKYAMEELMIDDLVIIVHPKHVPIYKEVLLFEELVPGEVRSYSKVNHNPAVALTINLHEVKRKYLHSYSGFPKQFDLHHFVFNQTTSNIYPINDVHSYHTRYTNNHFNTPIKI